VNTLFLSRVSSASDVQDSAVQKKKTWRFIFIVPSNVVSTFKRQQSKGDTDNNEWAGKVKQYVLGWEL